MWFTVTMSVRETERGNSGLSNPSFTNMGLSSDFKRFDTFSKPTSFVITTSKEHSRTALIRKAWGHPNKVAHVTMTQQCSLLHIFTCRWKIGLIIHCCGTGSWSPFASQQWITSKTKIRFYMRSRYQFSNYLIDDPDQLGGKFWVTVSCERCLIFSRDFERIVESLFTILI